MREEAPLYCNDRYDFYALSRFGDVERSLMDWDTYRISGDLPYDRLFKLFFALFASFVLKSFVRSRLT